MGEKTLPGVSHMSQVTSSTSPSLVQDIPVTGLPPSAGGSAHESHEDSRGWLRQSAPTAAIVLLLAGLALWSHLIGWRVPKFSALFGGSQEAAEDWCTEHNVAESICIECNPKLVPAGKDYGFCKVHGVPQCPLEHPEVAQLAKLPAVTSSDLEHVQAALAVKPRSENNSLCKLHEKRVQFASDAAAAKVGVDIAIVRQRPIVEAIRAPGEIVYDDTATAHLASRVQGSVWRIERQVGQPVRRGEILALVDAADVGHAKAGLLQAVSQARLEDVNVKRLRTLSDDGIIAGRRLQEAEAAAQQAKIRVLAAEQALENLGLSVPLESWTGMPLERIAEEVRFLGLPPELAASAASQGAGTNLFPVRSPLDGVVVERHATQGELVNPATPLFVVSDLRHMWIMLDVREEDAKRISLGQKVFFESNDDAEDSELGGTISWIASSADPQTRTIRVRVEVANPDGRLRAHTFGTGRIVLREEPRAIVVPNEAIHWEGCCHIVFVRDKDYQKEGAPKFYHVRKVRLGMRDDDETEILAGLLPGEVIASKNSFVLEAQLLKSGLGPGCGCVHEH